jgi:hypothetical protein
MSTEAFLMESTMPLTLYRKIKLGLVPANNRAPVEHRFWAKVNKDGPIHPTHGKCWLWTAGTLPAGYGRFAGNLAHRYSWRLHVGPIPAGMSILHKCDTPSCVNPRHLFLGTQQDNLADMREAALNLLQKMY